MRTIVLFVLLALLILPATAGATVLAGDQTVESAQDYAGSGFAQAFQYAAAVSGTSTDVQLYVSGSNAATSLQVGIYSDRSGQPSVRLASGSRTGLTSNAWNDITVGASSETAGAHYWIALLGAGGTLRFRDHGSGVLSYGFSTSTLPSTWSNYRESWPTGPASAYVNGTAIAPPVAPADTVLPAISGVTQEGRTLTASQGTWTGTAPISFSFLWSDGRTGPTDLLTAADVGQHITATVTASNIAGSTSATSASVGPVAPLPTPVNTRLPVITGSPQSGQTLTVSSGSWTNSPASFTYLWSDGTIGNTDLLTAADVGQTISATVTATNDRGSTPATSLGVGPVTAPSSCPVAQPQATWAPVGSGPQMTDAQAAACVQHVAETVPANQPYTSYVPTSAEESTWQAVLPAGRQEHTPEVNAVDGLDGLVNPSTDDLIQWATYKWGVPADWVRAEAMQESHWTQTDLGDIATVSLLDYAQYPALAQVSGPGCTSSCQAARSLGLMQVSWTPEDQSGNGFGVGTEPLRWESMAFNLDFFGATVRWYYDGHCSWCGAGYSSGQQWPSIGAWFEPTPWGNSGAQSYISEVQTHLANRDWPH